MEKWLKESPGPYLQGLSLCWGRQQAWAADVTSLHCVRSEEDCSGPQPPIHETGMGLQGL